MSPGDASTPRWPGGRSRSTSLNPLVNGDAVPAIGGSGTGLIGLTERVRLAGGELDHQVTGGEFRLSARLPCAGMTGPVRVLLVDDDALVRAGLSMMLDGADGIAVTGEAADGDQVMAAVDAHSPDVVLMDLRMPRVDRDHRHPPVPGQATSPRGDRAHHLRRR